MKKLAVRGSDSGSGCAISLREAPGLRVLQAAMGAHEEHRNYRVVQTSGWRLIPTGRQEGATDETVEEVRGVAAKAMVRAIGVTTAEAEEAMAAVGSEGEADRVSPANGRRCRLATARHKHTHGFPAARRAVRVTAMSVGCIGDRAGRNRQQQVQRRARLHLGRRRVGEVRSTTGPRARCLHAAANRCSLVSLAWPHAGRRAAGER